MFILSDRECIRYSWMFLMHVNDVFIMSICVDFAELNGTNVGDQHQLNIRDRGRKMCLIITIFRPKKKKKLSLYMITQVQVYYIY